MDSHKQIEQIVTPDNISVNTMRSPQLNELFSALCKAQGVMKPAVFNRSNPHFKNKYADLTSMWEACREALSANGLSVIQYTQPCDYLPSKLELVTMLGHSSGQFIKCVYPLHCEGMTPQKIGSALTYARRYSFSALLGICSEEDDDGTEAEKSNAKPLYIAEYETLSQEEISKIMTLAEYSGDCKAKIDRILAGAKKPELRMVPKDKFADICKWLQSQIEKVKPAEVTV